ncbi:hypothetical protein DNTS_021727 [Danionella cerebrum]|uniref:ubiquitinyl hydrolase 1 n=1 Tax=Danionella cerebrum TaxID=2873325 RepID=A0A553NJ67_9TELE|nr:hypothetical protein DNTS_021727 [Danionella translucida]TRY65502.1 hypothetical protein DNTS_021727 [Danionella translucida]
MMSLLLNSLEKEIGRLLHGIMSNDAHRRRPLRKYMVASDFKLQDPLEGTIRLQQGYLCEEPEDGNRAAKDHLWVKVIDLGSVVKLHRHALSELAPSLSALLEPVPDLRKRVCLVSKPRALLRFWALPLGSEVCVLCLRGISGEPAPAVLRYRGLLSPRASAVFFGVQLKGWAAGLGRTNGSFKGRQFFICPENCGLFLPVSELLIPQPTQVSRDHSSNPNHRKSQTSVDQGQNSHLLNRRLSQGSGIGQQLKTNPASGEHMQPLHHSSQNHNSGYLERPAHHSDVNHSQCSRGDKKQPRNPLKPQLSQNVNGSGEQGRSGSGKLDRSGSGEQGRSGSAKQSRSGSGEQGRCIHLSNTRSKSEKQGQAGHLQNPHLCHSLKDQEQPVNPSKPQLSPCFVDEEQPGRSSNPCHLHGSRDQKQPAYLLNPLLSEPSDLEEPLCISNSSLGSVGQKSVLPFLKLNLNSSSTSVNLEQPEHNLKMSRFQTSEENEPISSASRDQGHPTNPKQSHGFKDQEQSLHHSNPNISHGLGDSPLLTSPSHPSPLITNRDVPQLLVTGQRDGLRPVPVTKPKPLPKLPLLPLTNGTGLQPSINPQNKDLHPQTPLKIVIRPSMLISARKSLQPPSSSISSAQKPAPPLKPKVALQPPAKQQALSINQSEASIGFQTPPSPPITARGTWLEVGSMVEVNDPPIFGVVRWIGQIYGESEAFAGIELDEEISDATNGSFQGEQHFVCPANKGLFVKLGNCKRDSRFPEPELRIDQVNRCNSIGFAQWSSQRVEEHTAPPWGQDAHLRYEGFKRGIQGHHNSCYLDATLFRCTLPKARMIAVFVARPNAVCILSLFSCSSSFDRLLFCPVGSELGLRAQDLLRCQIINPLRRFGYVCASKTMALRKLLKEETADSGFTSQEKDPEEFLSQLFLLLQVEPFLTIRAESVQDCFLYQLFPPPVSSSTPPRVSSVQSLLESSFMHSSLKLTEAPSCLPLLMPRFGKEFKMFEAILPSATLDITDLVDDSLRKCSICRSAAHWECEECYYDEEITPGEIKQYCNPCNTQVNVTSTQEASMGDLDTAIQAPSASWESSRQLMHLFAVTCGENGFSVPQVHRCPEVSPYLSLTPEELSRIDLSTLRGPVKRLLCDAHMCFYHCPHLTLYK